MFRAHVDEQDVDVRQFLVIPSVQSLTKSCKFHKPGTRVARATYSVAELSTGREACGGVDGHKIKIASKGERE
jgi:hypothetical protein